MNTSEAINEIATALAKAQGELENASKNAKNGHFKNEYADLGEVLATVRPVLSKHGIALIQMTAVDQDAMSLHTRLIHSSGQWFESVHPVAKLPEKPQVIGANETYARRYSLAAICGIAQEDDDLGDGKKAGIAGAAQDKWPDEEISAKVHDMLIGAIEATQSLEELDEWRGLSSTKTAARKLTPEHGANIKEAVEKRRKGFPAETLEAAE